MVANVLTALAIGLLGLGVGETARALEADGPGIGEAPIQLETRTGKIDGTLDLPANGNVCPVVILVAGSGPTDRDGNQPHLKNDSLKQLGRGLAANGIAVLRYDRRGVGKSIAAGPKEEDFRFEMLVDDVVEWIKLLREDRRFSRVAVAGHSEGALVGMLAARQGGADAFISLAGCGRPASEVLRWQLERNLPKELGAQVNRILDELSAGRTVADPPKALFVLFRPSVQPYLISYFKYDPAREIARLEIPVMVVQGAADLQTPLDEARRLTLAKKDARLCVIDGMNHVLKPTAGTTIAEQSVTYTDPSLPLSPELVGEVSAFLSKSLMQR